MCHTHCSLYGVYCYEQSEAIYNSDWDSCNVLRLQPIHVDELLSHLLKHSTTLSISSITQIYSHTRDYLYYSLLRQTHDGQEVRGRTLAFINQIHQEKTI